MRDTPSGRGARWRRSGSRVESRARQPPCTTTRRMPCDEQPPAEQHERDCPEDLMLQDRKHAAGGMCPVKTRNGRSTRPANGSAMYDRLRPIRKQGQREIMPESNVTSVVRRIDRALAADGPQEADVDQGRQRAAEEQRAHQRAPQRPVPLRSRADWRAAIRPSPISGRTPAAITHIGTARRMVGAVRQASARAYQSEYRSTGRHSSYATAPLRTMARTSASAFHGSIASSA